MSTVLIVEDTEELRAMLVILVNRLGYDAAEATNGLEGIKLAQAIKPSLIILDLMMPTASGDLTLGFIRSTDSLKHTPVIVTSAHPKAQEIAQSLGADACLEKPFDFGLLKSWIQRLAPVDVS